ncbi:MAG: outer membrane lipoprotein carrier protein LolA [Phycisphaeraceae bacterium]
MNHPLPLTVLLIAAFAALAACTADAGTGHLSDPSGAEGDEEVVEVEEGDAPAEAGQWLDRIEARAAEIDTLTARVRYERIQMLLGDKQTRFGQLTYDAGPPARFHVHFDRLAVHDELQPDRHVRYIFDGRWLAERRDNERVFIRRELVAEDEVGQDLLRLGEGPFALPLDLEKQTVLERFTVELVEEDEPAVENTVMLRLTPLPNVEIDETLIEMWYDRDTLLPAQVRSVDERDQTESVIRLGNVETGVEVEEDVFDTQPPGEAGWQVEVHGLE